MLKSLKSFEHYVEAIAENRRMIKDSKALNDTFIIEINCFVLFCLLNDWLWKNDFNLIFIPLVTYIFVCR